MLNKNEINPGGFPEGLEPEDFIKKDIESILRNPLIANVLYLSKDIERWGSGLKRIYKECSSNNVGVEFKREKGGSSVIFYRPKKDLKSSEKTVEKIIHLIRENPNITQKDLVKKTGITRRGVEWNLLKLKQKGLLKRIGPDKGGHWKVVR